MARSNLVPYAFVWETGKTVHFSKEMVVYDIKVGRCNLLNENMNVYEYQRSRSFIDRHLRSLRFIIFKLLFLKNRLADWSQISCGASMGYGNESAYKWFMSHDQGGRHYHIWSKHLKIFFSKIKRPVTLKLGMQHWVLEYYQICSNDVPGLILTYLTAGSNLVPYAFAWKKLKQWIFHNVL